MDVSPVKEPRLARRILKGAAVLAVLGVFRNRGVVGVAVAGAEN